jgi:hypothetical protein
MKIGMVLLLLVLGGIAGAAVCLAIDWCTARNTPQSICPPQMQQATARPTGQIIELRQARLCIGCNRIYEGQRCPSCTSTVSMSVQGLVDRSRAAYSVSIAGAGANTRMVSR